jgi:chromosome segregation ATPase
MSISQPQPQPPVSDAESDAGNQPDTGKRRNWWIWVSVVLAVALLGTLIWQRQVQSDLDAAQDQISQLQRQIDEGEQAGSEAAASYKAAYEDLEEELGNAQEDLAATRDGLDEAQQAAKDAEQRAAEAERAADGAGNAVDEANAKADQAAADAESAEAQLTVATGCANTFIDQLASVMQSSDPTAAATAAKSELQGVAADCREVFGR